MKLWGACVYLQCHARETELHGCVTVAIFEFGRGFYGNTYTSVSSGLTLTPGPLQIFFVTASEGKLGTRLTYVQQPVANK